MGTPTLAERLEEIRARWSGRGSVPDTLLAREKAADDLSWIHRILTRLGDAPTIVAMQRVLGAAGHDISATTVSATLSSAITAAMQMEE